GFSRLSTRLFALPLALSMEAHYREQILSGNPISAIKLQKSAISWLSISTHSLYTDLSTVKGEVRTFYTG
ncbi:hypothetical protein, partial [Aeromonas veronii]|uniref:hypothetical protein n=1 Tax=Aeromonas veronii TaxID=654 RepID=UPI003B9801E8